jgi:hypothetical protein
MRGRAAATDAAIGRPRGHHSRAPARRCLPLRADVRAREGGGAVRRAGVGTEVQADVRQQVRESSSRRHRLESRAKAASQLGIEVSAGWESPSSRGLWGGSALRFLKLDVETAGARGAAVCPRTSLRNWMEPSRARVAAGAPSSTAWPRRRLWGDSLESGVAEDTLAHSYLQLFRLLSCYDKLVRETARGHPHGLPALLRRRHPRLSLES